MIFFPSTQIFWKLWECTLLKIYIYIYIFKKKSIKKCSTFLLLNWHCQVIFISWHHDKSLWTQTALLIFFLSCKRYSIYNWWFNERFDFIITIIVFCFFQNHADLVASSHFRPWEIHGCVFSASLRSHRAGAALIDPPNANRAVFGAKQAHFYPSIPSAARSEETWCLVFLESHTSRSPSWAKFVSRLRLETPSSRGITRQPACCLCLIAVLFPTFGF